MRVSVIANQSLVFKRPISAVKRLLCSRINLRNRIGPPLIKLIQLQSSRFTVHIRYSRNRIGPPLILYLIWTVKPLTFQWRLKRLWNYLFENYGMGEPEMDMIWSEARRHWALIKLTLGGTKETKCMAMLLLFSRLIWVHDICVGPASLFPLDLQPAVDQILLPWLLGGLPPIDVTWHAQRDSFWQQNLSFFAIPLIKWGRNIDV